MLMSFMILNPVFRKKIFLIAIVCVFLIRVFGTSSPWYEKSSKSASNLYIKNPTPVMITAFDQYAYSGCVENPGDPLRPVSHLVFTEQLS